MNNLNEQQPSGEAKPMARADKKPYVAPRLRMLGSVRELTQGGGSTIPDGMDTMEAGL
jgi:hypothetical protein